MPTKEEKKDKLELEFEALQKLNKDLRDAATLMKWDEARYLVDLYYQLQNYRLSAKNQIRAAQLEPNSLLAYFGNNFKSLENNVKSGLKTYVKQYSVGQWAMSVCGIGEVLAAGFLTLLDIRKAPVVQNFYSFAGIAPGIKWGKGERRPWCADLKTLCFKAGDCFVKFQNNPNDFYGKIYVERKKYEISKNENGDYENQALEGADRVGKTTEAYIWYSGMHTARDSRDYWELSNKFEGTELTKVRKELVKARKKVEYVKKQGIFEPVTHGVPMLSPGHLHSRARRYCIKMFISHLHHVMHVDYYGREPQFPFQFTKWPDVHTHFVAPPIWPFEATLKAKSLKQMYGEEK